MVLPRVFSNERERIIASFDFTDIAEGSGIIQFNLAAGENTGGEFYNISRRADRTSITSLLSSVNNQTEFTLGLDKDFDSSPFKLTRTITGNITTGFTWSQWGGSGSISTLGFVKIIVKRVRGGSGGTETVIATMQSPTLADDEGRVYKTDYLEGTATRTHLKIGDILRVTVEMWSYQNGGTSQGSQDNILYFDPQNAEIAPVTAGNTKFFINIPFKIDL